MRAGFTVHLPAWLMMTRREFVRGATVAGCVCTLPASIGGSLMATATTETMEEKIRPHQAGESSFEAITSENLDWKPFPAFPPAARLAVLVGDPSQDGPYVIRVKVPGGTKLMPHRHPEDRVYTIISGVFYIGLGEQFDAEKLQAYPPGSVIVLPGNTAHFHWAKSGEYISQVNAIGPLGLEYVDPKDDPRKQ